MTIRKREKHIKDTMIRDQIPKLKGAVEGETRGEGSHEPHF